MTLITRIQHSFHAVWRVLITVCLLSLSWLFPADAYQSKNTIEANSLQAATPIVETGDVYYFGDPIPVQVSTSANQVSYKLEWVYEDRESGIGETYTGTGTVTDVAGLGRVAYLPTSMLTRKGVYVLSGDGISRRRVLLVDPLPSMQDPQDWPFGFIISRDRIEQQGAALAEELYRVGVHWSHFDFPFSQINNIGASSDPNAGRISAQYEAFINHAHELGIVSIFKLMSHYSQISEPTNPNGNFYNGLRKIQAYYQGKIKWWTFSNEADPGGYYSDFSAEQFGTVLKNMSIALKGVDPNVKIMAGELANAWQQSFTQIMLDPQYQDYWDSVSGHRMNCGYEAGANSGSIDYREKMEAAGVGDRPLWDTESSGTIFGGPSEWTEYMYSRHPCIEDSDTHSGVNKVITRTFCLEAYDDFAGRWRPAFYKPDGSCVGADMYIGMHYNASWESFWALRNRWINDSRQESAPNHKMANFRAVAEMLFGAEPITRIPNMQCGDPYNCSLDTNYANADGYIYKYGPEYFLALWQNSGSINGDREIVLTTDPQDQIVLFDSFGNAYPLQNNNGEVKVWVRSEMVYVRGFTRLPVFALETSQNDAPYFVTKPPLPSAVVGRQYTYNAWAYDSDRPTSGSDSQFRIRYELVDGPQGMNLSDSTAGLVVWTPSSPGAYSVTIRAHSEHGTTKTADQTFTIHVADAGTNLIPQILSTPITPFGRPGFVWRYNVNAHDVNGDEITYSLSKAPAGMSIDPDSGLIQWTPTTGGMFPVIVVADDGVVQNGQAFTIVTSGTLPPTFGDVPFSHMYHDEIEVLYQNGYTAGCGYNPLLYCPDVPMTRAESSVFVERGIHGVEILPTQPSTQVFDDLPLDEWAVKWVTALWNDGYTAGCGTDPMMYCPWQGHTRAEGAVFYLRMLNGADYTPPNPQGIFSDVPSGWWGEKWVEEAYNAGILPDCGTQPLRACPGDSLTRGLAAYMMVHAKGLD